MKKTLTVLLAVLLTITLLTACSKYNVDKNLTPEKQTEHETILEESLAAIGDENSTAVVILQATQEAAVRYARLGDYKNAIKYYEKVLEKAPADFLTLNNLSALYEEIEEYELAAKYVVQLHVLYKEKQGVINDTIRILVKNGRFEDAQLVLNEYASNYQSDATAPFISEQFEYINRMRNKAEGTTSEE